MKIVEAGGRNLACGGLRSAVEGRDEETDIFARVAVVS